MMGAENKIHPGNSNGKIYLKVTGGYCQGLIIPPEMLEDYYIDGMTEEDTYIDIYMTEEEYENLPEWDG